uniref:Uncharacterized protein n=1 Tax=Sphenodon punctatus TaxID=8508 RepID=A0A8D0GY12_SPHPU
NELGRALAHELLCPQGGPSCEYFLVLARTHLLKKDYSQAEECLQAAIQIDYLNPDVWAQRGHLCYLTGNLGEAKECYERTVDFVTDASEIHFVYLRLGSIYLEEKEEANALNNKNAEVWAYLALVCLQVSAHLSPIFLFPMQLELDNEALRQEIEQVQAQLGFGNPSF